MTAAHKLTLAFLGLGTWLPLHLPAQQRALGRLRIIVAHPAPGAVMDVGDSLFLFGTVSDSAASLTIAGHPVSLAPNGAWLAWIGIPHDSILTIPLDARHGAERTALTLRLTRAHWTREVGAWVDRGSLTPTAPVILPSGEQLPLTVRAAPGASVRLVLPDGATIPFAADSLPGPVAEGIRAFDHDDRNLHPPVAGDRYVAVLRGAVGRAGNTLLASVTAPADTAVLEVALGRDTVRLGWSLAVTRTALPPIAVILDGNPQHDGRSDPMTIGRTEATGTYAWFFPAGTRTRADMQIGDQVRLRLAQDAVAWVPRADVHPAAARDDARHAVMGSPVLRYEAGYTQLRIPMSSPPPISVTERGDGLDITLFGAVADANWTRYGTGLATVRLLTWQQRTSDEVVVSLNLAQPLWGWRVRVDGNDLVFDVRTPPAINPVRPLAGRVIAIDAGHPPGGACGPTGYCEPEANLAVARLVRDALIARGAHVLMTRDNNDSIGLWPRAARADTAGTDLFVSVHHNALPDGVNPLTNSGTSSFFNHPQALSLAAALQRALVAAIRLPDLGIARGDLAVTRSTWYPAVLLEGYTLAVPEHERLARSSAGQQRYADGVVSGITAWLRTMARRPAAGP